MISIRKSPGFLHLNVMATNGHDVKCGVDMLHELPWRDFVPSVLAPALRHLNTKLPENEHVTLEDVERAMG